MRRQSLLMKAAAAAVLMTVAANSNAQAAEAALGSYGVGSNAFGAGVTPPAGTYVTTAVGYYQAEIGGQIPFHGVVINAGATIDFFVSTLNAL